MKIGDLVQMPSFSGMSGDCAVGVVIKMPPIGNDGEVRRDRGTPKVLVAWADGGGMMDWEPMDWLEVISAAR